jgi:hypothetical protein
MLHVSGWVFAVSDGGIAAVLLNAGGAKLVAPGALQRALAELVPLPGGSQAGVLVRGIAAAELLLAAAFLVPAAHLVAAIALVAFGGLIAAVGLLGLLRRTTAPCGCFGGSTSRPLGLVNVAFGAVMIVLGITGMAAGPSAASPGPGAAAAVLVASIGTVVLCLWLHRRLVLELLMPARLVRSGGETP